MVITVFLVAYVACLMLYVYKLALPQSTVAKKIDEISFLNAGILFIIFFGTAQYVWDYTMTTKKVSLIFFLMAAVFWGTITFCSNNDACKGLQSIAKDLVTALLVIIGVIGLIFGI